MADEKPRRRVLISRAHPKLTSIRLTEAAHEELQTVAERTGLQPAILMRVAVQEFLVRQRSYGTLMQTQPSAAV